MPSKNAPTATSSFPPLVLPKNSSQVPRFTELRKMINYGEDRKPLGPTFWKHLQVFRELYRSPSGVRGQDFIKWKDQKHRDGLIQMAITYLDTQGNGRNFWPADTEAAEYNTLQYSRPVDHEFIKSTLVQLLFRLNRQQSSNDKYKQKKKAGLDEASGPQRDQPAPTAATPSSTIHHATPNDVETVLNEGYTVSTFALSTVHRDLLKSTHTDLHSSGPPATGTGETEADPYLIPESPTSVPHDGQLSFQVNLNKDDRSKDHRPDSPPTRSRSAQETSGSKPKQRMSKRKRRRTDHAPVSRNPPRLRNPPRRLRSMASHEAIEAACRSPQSSTEPPDSPKHTGTSSTQEPGSRQPDRNGETALSRGAVHRDQPPSCPQASANSSVERAPEASTGGRSHPMEAMEIDWPPGPSRQDASEAPRWPPAPFVEDAEDIYNWQPESSVPDEPERPFMEDRSFQASEPSQAESHTVPLLSTSASERAHPCETHPFGSDAESVPLELSQPTTLLTHSDPAYHPAPEAIMELPPVASDEDVSSMLNQATTADVAQFEPLQGTESHQTETIQVEAPQTEDAQSKDFQTEHVRNEDAQTENVHTEDAQTEDVQTEDVQTEVADTEPVDTEPVDTEPVDTEPVDTEPVDTEPVDTELNRTDTVQTEHLQAEGDQNAVAQKELPQSEPLRSNTQPPSGAPQDDRKISSQEIDKSESDDRMQHPSESEITGKPYDERESDVLGHKGPGIAAHHAQQAVPEAGPPGNRPTEPVDVGYKFMLILARFPYWQGREWVPKGKFLKKSLPELMEELPQGFAGNAPGLMFRLIGPGFRTEEPIPHGEDGSFDFMRRGFAEQIRKTRREHTGGPLSFRIEIEGLRDDYFLKADDGSVEEDMESLC